MTVALAIISGLALFAFGLIPILEHGSPTRAIIVNLFVIAMLKGFGIGTAIAVVRGFLRGAGRKTPIALLAPPRAAAAVDGVGVGTGEQAFEKSAPCSSR
ncbi:hypothetical protein ACWIGM_12535 [Bosea sp. NPDC055332]